MVTWKKVLMIAAAVTLLVVGGSYSYFEYFTRTRLLVSTTTSLWETGLLNVTKQAFEAKYRIDIGFLPVGTGQAIQEAQGGNVDALLVHSPSNESQFLQGGDGSCRKIIAYNFFTIVGPNSDPAGINGSTTTTALQKIVDYGRSNNTWAWVSRGDGSGTHTKEKTLWAKANYNYTQISQESSWYASAGSSMSATLNMANEFRAYTLADIGTYLKMAKDHTISLVQYLAETKDLLNVYSVIAVNQTRHASADFSNAITFIKSLI